VPPGTHCTSRTTSAPIKMAIAPQSRIAASGMLSIPPFTALHRRSKQAFASGPIHSIRKVSGAMAFHGLSYEYIGSGPGRSGRPEIANGRVCRSASRQWLLGLRTAGTRFSLRDQQWGSRRSMGCPMGTRLRRTRRPAVVLHLIQHKGMSPEELVDLLYKRSGMPGGCSGISSRFFREPSLASDNPRGRVFAIEVFCLSHCRPYRLACRRSRRPSTELCLPAGVGRECRRRLRSAVWPCLRPWLGVDPGRSGQPWNIKGAHKHAEQPCRLHM